MMSLFNRLFGKPKKEEEKADETPKAPVPVPDTPANRSSFMDMISDMAMQVKNSPAQMYDNPRADLSTISAVEYPAAEISEATQTRINELRDIIASIENRKPTRAGVALSGSYKIPYSTALNPAQLEAVTSIKGPVLVIAGAGSGKTRVIVYRVAFLIENGVPPQEIVLLTFTRRAAAEMLGRVQQLLLENPVQNIFGGTFHSFANYVLRKYANMLQLQSNFTIIDTEDSADTIDLIRSELKEIKADKAFPKKNRIQEIISSARNRNLTIQQVIEKDFTGLNDYVGALVMINQAYERYKKICNIFDYDDLMDVLRNSLRDHAAFRTSLQQEYKYIMVDEYQDTNVIQKEIVELMAGEQRNVMIVGDDAQSIYSFRGANYENILRFPQKYPDCRVVKIEENYRSNQQLLDFTNDIIRNARIGYKKKLYSNIKREGMPFVSKFYDQQSEAEFIVNKILEYREKGIALNQVAILVRAFWHARYIETELNRRGIPYIAVGGLAFNERRHIKDIISYLRIVQNPYDAVAWHRVLKYLPGVGLVTARKIIEKINAEKQLNIRSFESSRFYEGLRDLTDMLNRAGKTGLSVAHVIGIIREYYTHILQATENDYQIRLLDIDVLSDLSHKYDNLTKFLTDFALDPPSKKFGDRTIPLIDEGEDKPLTISTIHSAKGLEWYGVIIPHALDGLLPSVRAMKNLEELEEERRLFYVACSRAKQELIITMPSYVSTYNGFMSYPCRFLAEIEKDKYRYQ
jgi:DNA helicase II / ATP-dependent DNA helicase PcrA